MTYIDHAENRQLGILRGYTEGISTIPGWQRRGVARALIARSLKMQREAGMKESALVCSGEKPNNIKLYSSCGFQEVKRDTVYEKPLVIGRSTRTVEGVFRERYDREAIKANQGARFAIIKSVVLASKNLSLARCNTLWSLL